MSTNASVIVSVVVANFNGAAFIGEAVRSACRQTLRDIEIIVSDDASTDNSVDIVRQLMQRDPRIRLLTSDRNHGPAAARNRALASAVGGWIAVLDSDDVMHPERLAALIEAAVTDDADIVADDLLTFDSAHARVPRPLLRGRWGAAPFWVDIESYVRTNVVSGRGPALGYLKPIFRASLLREKGVRYDERLRVAEDFDLVFRLLRAGARFRVYPRLLYFYRTHAGSISHRLTVETIEAMKVVDRERRASVNGSRKLAAAMEARTRSLNSALAFVRLVDAIKRRDVIGACRVAFERPQALRLFWQPIAARLKKYPRAPVAGRGDRKRQVCVLTRQRVVGPINGSSTYLLELVRALAKSGAEVSLLSPSPTTLGRWPYLKLGPELDIFRNVWVRGTFRVGRFLVAKDPWIFVQGFLAIAERACLKVGLLSRPVLKPAPYAVACPLTRADELFVAQHCPSVGDVLVADYCFLTPTFPYALRPDAKTAVVMHDLFSSRASQFKALNSLDSVVGLSDVEECKLLGQAQVVVAIQSEEAEFVRRKIPGTKVIVVPMAVTAINAPQAGRDDCALFIGSSTAPNVDGLRWFFEFCWPKIRLQRPSAVLRVAGTVCQKIGRPPPGVELLGVVGDLGPLYAEAAVVISPLRIGSGLKIKLIEALGVGKAVVATSVTLQGVSDELHDCVWLADDPEVFASGVIQLLGNEAQRKELATRGLGAARQHFSPEACYGELVRVLAQ
jgi:succinoglycan biosynthesis protein ExoO